MTRLHRHAGLLLAALLTLALPPAAHGGEGDAEGPSENGAMTAEQYRLYQDYKRALRDSRVEAMAEHRRVPAIAENFGVPVSELEAVIEKGDAQADDLLESSEAAARSALSETSLSDRLRSVEVLQSRRGTVVAQASWEARGDEGLVEDAVRLAHSVVDGAPAVGFVALWACMGDRKVFSAQVQGSAARRIDPSRIEHFAATRYIRLFENVRNLFDGEPPEDAEGCE